MSSRSSHHQHTSTHPYHVEPQQSTSTLASSTGETKKMFLGRWKSVFKKEAMEVLPEQDSPIFSSLLRPRITHLQALPPIQSKPLPPPQNWPGTLFDSDWEQQARAIPQQPSNLPAVVLGMTQFFQPLVDPTISSSVPLPSSILSGTTSIYPTRPSLPHEGTHTIGEPQSTLPSYTGMNPYESQRDLPLPQGRENTPHQSSPSERLKEEGSTFQGEEGSLRGLSLRSQRSSPNTPETEDRQSVRAQRPSEESMKDIKDRESCRSTVGEKLFTTPPQTAIPAPRDSLTKSTSMEFSMGEVHPPRQSPHSRP